MITHNKYEKATKILISEYKINVVMWRKPTKLIGGLAYINAKIIRSPYPKSNKSFAIFAHEIGHIANGAIKPICLGEYKLKCLLESNLNASALI
jgi:hypothetical protein